MSSNVSIGKAVPDEDEVRLWDPLYEGYSYGPGGIGDNIDFGVRGGFEPRVWIGPRDHPLLDGLLRERPDLIEGDGDDATRVKVYVCAECNKEVTSLIGYKSHVRTHRQTVTDTI